MMVVDQSRGLPSVMPNEDGEIVWAQGHIGSHLFVRAMIRRARVDGWEDDLRALCEMKPPDVTLWRWLRSRVRHSWMCVPANEEIYRWCTPEHPRAEAYTHMDIS